MSNAGAVRLYERLGYSRLGEPVVDRWTRLADDGGSEQVEELSWVMVRPLREAKNPHHFGRLSAGSNLLPAAGGRLEPRQREGLKALVGDSETASRDEEPPSRRQAQRRVQTYPGRRGKG